MNRRFFVSSAAAVSVAALSACATAAEHQHNHAGHATAAASPNNPFMAAHKAAADCVNASQFCLAHCVRLLSAGDTSMADCAKSASQTIELCSALKGLAAQNSPLTAELAKVCIKACKACADACKSHAAHHAECKACYESCLACIKECEKIAA